MKSLDFSLLLIEGENVGTYLKSITTDDDVWIFFFATGLSVSDAMHISETLAKSLAKVPKCVFRSLSYFYYLQQKSSFNKLK